MLTINDVELKLLSFAIWGDRRESVIIYSSERPKTSLLSEMQDEPRTYAGTSTRHS